MLANDEISLELQAGRVLALLGENGAGKSTLVSILFGHYTADDGEIFIEGERLPPGDPAASLARGIGMVHQHFALADNLTVLENVIAGTRRLGAWTLRSREARKRLLDIAQRFGLDIDPAARVGDLSVGERQRAEIIKALYRGARILILDEPTAVLTPQESESLFATLQQLLADGLAIIFISHKLDEVLRVSDHIAVLRNGRLVAHFARGEADRGQLAQAMVGRRLDPPTRDALAIRGALHDGLDGLAGLDERDGRDGRDGLDGASNAGAAGDTATTAGVAADPVSRTRGTSPPVLRLRNASLRGPDGRARLTAVSLEVRPGEITGIAGVSGNGQAALADVLCGLTRLDSGDLCVDDKPLRARPREFTAAGIARIPEDRHAVGVVGDLSVWENAILERVHEPAMSRFGWLRRRAARRYARHLVETFDVRGLQDNGLNTPTRILSGGNIQKLILGRALLPRLDDRQAAPRVIIANQPTWGLDVGAVAFVRERLVAAASAGAAVVLISEDLDELFAIADDIAVIHAGRLTPARPAGEWTMSAIGTAMAGSHVH